ncbi:MAG: hypothetical protein ACRDTS_16505 [Mycobacterium sp.]
MFFEADSNQVDWIGRMPSASGHIRGWAPSEYDTTVIMLNPITLIHRDDDGVWKSPMAWAEVAERVGIDPNALRSGYPKLDPLRDAAARHLDPNDNVEWPQQGETAVVVRAAIARAVVTERNRVGTVGFYLGGHGGFDADWLASPMVVREVGQLQYGFVGCRLGSFFDAWTHHNQQIPDGFDSPEVSFVWPDNGNWFVNIDPDSCFATLSGGGEIAGGLLNDQSVETWHADDANPWGQHYPGSTPRFTSYRIERRG